MKGIVGKRNKGWNIRELMIGIWREKEEREKKKSFVPVIQRTQDSGD